MMIGALVLAAGLGRRMGGSKLDMLLDGQPVLAHVLQRLAVARLPVLVVTGGHDEKVRKVVGALPVAHAADHALGLAASIRSGIAAVPSEWDGLLVALGDMPFVRAETYAKLAVALAAGAGAVVPVQGGQWGNPAGFSRRHFAALSGLAGDAGARALLRPVGARALLRPVGARALLRPVGARALLRPICAMEIHVDDAGIHRDIDMATDLPKAAGE